MHLLDTLVQKAKQAPRTIVLPEGTEERTLKAADRILADGVAKIILIGEPDDIHNKANELGLKHLSGARIISPTQNPDKQKHADLLYELRKKKGMTPEDALKKVEDPLYLATLLIKSGEADGEVAGAQNTTGNVLRPALQIIKTKPGVRVVSGAFVLIMDEHLQDRYYGEEGVLVLADCAVMPNPTAEELAQIAVSSADTARAIVGMEPRIAMLSFSTKGSAKHEHVDKVVEATKLAHELAPDLQIDGELQVDAALDPKTGAQKAPGSTVAGKANVLVFPDLQSGNIGYKLAQRLGGATAVGPILQGIAHPVNDLSRGCSVEDVYHMIAITSLQASAAIQ